VIAKVLGAHSVCTKVKRTDINLDPKLNDAIGNLITKV
jgi:hypothetical protein